MSVDQYQRAVNGLDKEIADLEKKKAAKDKEIVAHEFGHAIAYSYHLEEDVIIKSLYEKYKHGFENMQEFIAECFMASELTNEVTLSNNVKNRINEIAEVKN